MISKVLIFLTCIFQATGMKMFSQFSRKEVLQPFLDGNALKIISGLQNFDTNFVKNVVSAAYNGGASHVDIACDPLLVSLIKSKINIPVCVSAVEPKKFVDAVNAGADMIEIGNFDSFYEHGIKFSAEDVLRMTKETRSLLPDIPLSVTIPYHLSIVEQVSLAQKLETLNVDIIQTEGKFKVSPIGKNIQEMIEIASPTIATAYTLSRSVKIPVMCASGLTDVTVPLAIAAGARGVGIGSMVSSCKTPQQMLMAVSAIATSMGRIPSIPSNYVAMDSSIYGSSSKSASATVAKSI